MEKTNNYWNGNGKFQTLAYKLDKLVPISGEVADAKTNKALERYRRARIVYYDVFNNGLCNRAKEFKPLFGFAANSFRAVVHAGGRPYRSLDFDRIVEPMDKVMDQIIIAAAAEQNLIEEAK